MIIKYRNFPFVLLLLLFTTNLHIASAQQSTQPENPASLEQSDQPQRPMEIDRSGTDKLTLPGGLPDNQPDRHIRVGIFENYPVIYEKGGLPTGFQIELLREVAKAESWTLDYKFLGSLKNVIQGIELGVLDLGMGLASTEDRAEKMYFTKERNAMAKGQVFVKAGRTGIQSINDLNDKTVAVAAFGSLGQNLLNVTQKFGITPALRQVHSYNELALAIITDSVDAGLFYSQQGHYLAKTYKIESTSIEFKPVELQYAVLKGSANTVIIDALDQYMSQWKKINNSVYHALETEFLLDPLVQKSASSKKEILIALCICVLFITFGIMLGNYLSKEIEAKQRQVSTGNLQRIVLFAGIMSVSFWMLDSVVTWLFFNAELNYTLLELSLTKVPSENLYIRVMFFLVCCFFTLFLARIIGKYENAFNLLFVNMTRFEQLANNSKDMIYRMSIPQGEYEFVNKAALDISGYTPEEFYQRPNLTKKIVHPEWEKYFESKWQNLLSGKIPPYFEYQILNKSGETRWVNQRHTLYYDDSGAPVAVEGIMTDITEWKNAEKDNG